MSTAELAAWLHWQATWVRFRNRSSQPLADHPPVPPRLQTEAGREMAPSSRASPGPAAPGGALAASSLCPRQEPRTPARRTTALGTVWTLCLPSRGRGVPLPSEVHGPCVISQ